MAVKGPQRIIAALIAAAALCGPASAQLSLPVPSAGSLGDIAGGIGLRAPLLDRAAASLDPQALADLRRLRLRDLVRAHPRDLALDPQDAPIVRGEILAVAISGAALEKARAAGFTVLRSETLPGLDLSISTLAPPPRLGAAQALKRLRRLDPGGQYDFNHLYFSAAAAAPAPRPAPAVQRGSAPQAAVGMIDTGLDAQHPALAGVTVRQRGFAPGGLAPAAHGAAVASLIAGRAGSLPAPAAGAALYVADVYGAGPRGGSAEAIVRAFAWLLEADVKVINVSLVGPANAPLKAAVDAAARRGALVVAAVGNDGPAAPPAYPASYPGVIAVTAVDRRDRVLVEAGRALHVDFAAPGADIAAADQARGWADVRGTSFAAPIVARRLAQLRLTQPPAAALSMLSAQARDLGPKGVDKVYGRGLVGEEVRLANRP